MNLRRLLPAATLGTALATLLATPALAAGTGTAAAADWIAGSLTDGDHVVIGGFEYDGTGADSLYALVAAGGHADTVAAIDAHLKTRVDDYADPKGTGAFPGPYSGSLAKLALVAEITRQDPHAYAGTDLLGVLTDNTCTTANGSTCNAPGEFYQAFSTTSQALGIIALQRSPEAADHLTVASAPVVRLLALRCADGLFTGTLLAPGATCATGDVDSTAYAVQALAAVSGDDDVVVTSTLDALAAAQQAGGGFAGASGINTNSTGLALSAFSLQPAARTAVVAAATAFVTGLQQADDGRIATTAADTSQDGAKLATPQALLGLLGRSLSDPTLLVPAPTTTPTTPAPSTPVTSAPSSSGAAPASIGSTPELANTGAGDGHLPAQLLAGLGALAAGTALVGYGARRLPRARHRA